MFSARAFVGWYNGHPENREVSLGNPPAATSFPPLGQGGAALRCRSWGKKEPWSRTGRLPGAERRGVRLVRWEVSCGSWKRGVGSGGGGLSGGSDGRISPVWGSPARAKARDTLSRPLPSSWHRT